MNMEFNFVFLPEVAAVIHKAHTNAVFISV